MLTRNIVQGMSAKEYSYEKNYGEDQEGVVAYSNTHIDNDTQRFAALFHVRIVF